MRPISVVIVTKNEAHVIAETLAAVSTLTDDCIIGDNGSTDDTVALATAAGAKVHSLTWEGYGITKNKAIDLAQYDWVLALDADEIIDEECLQALQQLDLSNEKIIYKLKFRNFIGREEIKYGEWNIVKARLFNRKFTRWDHFDIHENVLRPPGSMEKTLPGRIIHKTMCDLGQYAYKMNHYGELMAQRYFKKGKKASFFKLYLYPSIVFIQVYIFKRGFLDGRIGFTAAGFAMYYSFFKYHRLKELEKTEKKSSL